MIGELVFVAKLTTAPLKRSDSQTFEQQSIEQFGNIESFDKLNYTQTCISIYKQDTSIQFTILDFFATMRDLDQNEQENYRNFLNHKKTIIKKSIF